MSPTKTSPDTVLLVDDQIGDLTWLVDRIEEMGYAFRCATNEDEARARLRAVANGEERYLFAVVDVMMATHDIRNLPSIDAAFFESSKDSGIRLCKYAREDLKISPDTLPIAVYTARSGGVKEALSSLPGIKLFARDGSEGEGSLWEYLDRMLEER